MARPVRVGCSGWNYADWRERVYERGLPTNRWLERYAELFDTVEVNSTFYRLARRDAVARWVEQTPPGFCFAAKASRYLIHMRKLRDIGQGVERFYERIEPLVDAGRLGPVLWQLPRVVPARRRPPGRGARAAAAGPPRVGVPRRELVLRAGLRAPARARLRAGLSATTRTARSSATSP